MSLGSTSLVTGSCGAAKTMMSGPPKTNDHVPVLGATVRLPDGLLHILLLHQTFIVQRGRHHEPEGHSGRVLAHDDVRNPGEFPRDNKHNIRVVKYSGTVTHDHCRDIKRIMFQLLLLTHLHKNHTMLRFLSKFKARK